MTSAEWTNEYSLRQARPEDLQSVCEILAAAELPTEDVSVEMLNGFIICAQDGAVFGVVGVEIYGTRALLRSLAVDEACRSQGIAARLLAAVEMRARQSGVLQLFALTVTAQRYLENHGYVRIERSQVPDAIQAHAQFRHLCPETAICLAKSLESSRALNQAENSQELAAAHSVELFDSGFYCAESVLLALAEVLDENRSVIPRIATGMCSGVARTCGLCGALLGAILGMGLAMGRTEANEPVDAMYQAVRLVRDRFESEFGSSECHVLTGCDLGTDEGQRRFRDDKLRARCRTYVASATEWALAAIVANQV